MSSSKIAFFLCISFISGIFIEEINQSLRLVFLIIAISMISVLWGNKKAVLFGFCIVFFVLGSLYINKKAVSDFGEVVFVGTIIEEPDKREDTNKLTVSSPKGKVLVTVNKYPEFNYGDKLKIEGELKKPAVFEDFNYKDYLKKEGIYYVSYFPKVSLISKGGGISFYRSLLSLKEKFRNTIKENLSFSQGSVLAAMVLGDKNRVSDNLKEKLNKAGVRHVTAVSGLHVVIISTALMSIFSFFGKDKAFYLSLIFIFLFVLLTGLQPSGVRAGIMGGVFLLGKKAGRKSVSSRTLVLVATLMLLFNPLLLRYDVGFQLSFLAVMGIITFSNFFSRKLKFIKFKTIREIVVITISAQLFVLPLLIYNFGRISLVSIFGNILILPVVWWVMVLGFLMIIFGGFFLAQILSLVLALILGYILVIVDLLALFPEITFNNVHWFWLLILYSILTGFAIWVKKKEKYTFLG